MTTFRYTDDQWQAIAVAIPADKAHQSARAKEALERAASNFKYERSIGDAFGQAVAKRNAWISIEKQCEDLASSIAVVEDWYIPFPDFDGPDDLERAETDRQRQLDFLKALADTARDNKANYAGHASMRKKRIDPDREGLYRAVMAVWADLLGEKLTISPTGPWPRFFHAALLPVLQKAMPALGSLKGIVEREKDRRSPVREQDQAGEVGARG